MTRKEAQVRNSKIMQFRGLAHRIKSLIPDDIWSELDINDKYIIDEAQKSYERVTKILNSKVKCRHYYFHQDIADSRIYIQDTKCNVCGHIKYSRDGLGKAGTF